MSFGIRYRSFGVAVLLCAVPLVAPCFDARGAESDALMPESSLSPRPLKLGVKAERQAEADARYLQSIFEEESDGPDRALDSKLKVLEIDPAYGNLPIDVAHQYLRSGDAAAAITVLKDATKNDRNNGPVHLALASIYLRHLHKPALAESCAQQALANDPNKPAAYESLAEIHTSTGQESKREALYQLALKRDCADPSFWMDLAEDQIRHATRSGKRPLGSDAARIGQFLDRASSHSGNKPPMLVRIADGFFACGFVAKAIPLYGQALELNAEIPDARNRLTACFLQNGDSAGAIKSLEATVQANPLDLAAYDQLAQLHLKGGNLVAALSNLRQSLLLSKPDPRRYEDVIRLSFSAKDLKSALDSADEAEKKFPNRPDFSLYRAFALAEENRHAEAIQAFERVLAAASDVRPDLLDSDFYFGYGAATEQFGDAEKAAGLLRKSIALDPAKAARACNYLGFMWADRGENLDEAEQLIRRALESDPSNGAYLDSLGWVLYRQGRNQEALAELLRSTQVLPEPDPVVLEHVGDVFEKLGKISEAVLYWQKARQLAPGNKGLLEKLDKHAARVARQPGSPTSQTPNP